MTEKEKPTEETRQPRQHGPGMRGPAEKPKNFKRSMGKLIRYCKPFRWSLIIALVASCVATVFQIVGPDQISKLTDVISKGLFGTVDMDAVWFIAILLGGFYSASLLLNIIENWLFAGITQKFAMRMRTEISTKINRLPLGYFHKQSYGDVLSRVTNDVDTIAMTLNQSIGALVTAFTLFFGSLLMMFVTNWIMALTAIGTTLVGFVMMIFIMKFSQKHFVAQQKELGAINGHIEETYTGHNVVKVYNGSAKSKTQFEVINGKLYQSGWKSQFYSGVMMPLMMFVGNFGYLSVCVVGATLALNGMITFGVIVAFMIYIRLFTQPLSQFAQAASNLQRAAAAGERVFEFIEAPEMEGEGAKTARLQKVRGAIDFQNVNFGYAPDKIIIHNFSATIKPGQKVAIVGPTGAGKTTMVNLLMRFYDVNSGQIMIDGVCTNDVPRENIHDQFCMVLQDAWIFDGTIKENIIYAMPNITDEQVVNACVAVGLHHTIMTLPDGYDTMLDDKSTLSEGEKQLLTIARAIIKNAPLLILDEATSSVDTRTERIVQAAMDKLTRGRTSFIIAHRLSTIKNADIIIVMRDGNIVEIGNHNELIAAEGFYAELYNSQFDTK